MDKKVDLPLMHTILQEIYNEINNLKCQGRVPTKVLANESTYRIISSIYKVKDLNSCFGLPLEICNVIRKHKVCHEDNKIQFNRGVIHWEDI